MQIKKTVFYSVLSAALIVPSVTFAQGSDGLPDIATMFSNFGDSAVSLMKLARWTAFLMGIVISIVAVLKLKEWSESQGRMSLAVPFWWLVTGIFLVSLPGSIDMVSETLSLSNNYTDSLLAEAQVSGGAAALKTAFTGVLLFFKLLGHFAVIRGFLALRKLGDQGGGGDQGGFWTAIVFIGAGAAVINLESFVKILGNTLAPGMDLGIV